MKPSLNVPSRRPHKLALLMSVAVAALLSGAATQRVDAQQNCIRDCQVGYTEENAACATEFGVCKAGCTLAWGDCTGSCDPSDSTCLGQCRDLNSSCNDNCSADEAVCASASGIDFMCCLDNCNGGNLCN